MSLLRRIFNRPLVVSANEQKREDVARLLALAGSTDHPIYEAVLGYADEHARNEHESVLAPNLSNEVRQFNAGRSASAYDFAIALRQIQERAEMQARKIKRAE